MEKQKIEPDKERKKVAIQLDDKWRISSTYHAWIIEEKMSSKWYQRRNYSSLQGLLKDFLETFIREEKGLVTSNKIQSINNALLTAVECQKHLIKDLADDKKRPIVNKQQKATNNS